MGFSQELFTDKNINDEFICSICHDVLQDVTMVDPCEHVFCKSCITEWRTTSTTCPIDREVITGLKAPQRVYTNLLKSLEIRCEFMHIGCPFKAKLGEMATHNADCEFNPENNKKCEGGCGLVLRNEPIEGHNCVVYLLEQLKIKSDALEKYELKLKAKSSPAFPFRPEVAGSSGPFLAGGNFNFSLSSQAGGSGTAAPGNSVLFSLGATGTPPPLHGSAAVTFTEFNPLHGTDTMIRNGQPSPINTRLQCISGMEKYADKSLEEVRLEYHQVHPDPERKILNKFGIGPANTTPSRFVWSWLGNINTPSFPAAVSLGQSSTSAASTPATAIYAFSSPSRIVIARYSDTPRPKLWRAVRRRQ